MEETTPAHICPACKSTDIVRMVTRGLRLQIVARVFRHRRYHCRECGAQFYDRPAEKKAS